MIAVSNSTPLNYLILIGAVDILPQLFDRVLIPEAVLSELQHSCTPESVRTWIANPPAWLEVRPVAAASDPSLALLGSSVEFRGSRHRTAAWMAFTCSTCASASDPIGPACGSQFGPMSSVTAPPASVARFTQVAHRSLG